VTDGNLVTAQQFPWFLEPTLVTAPSGQIWNAADYDVIETRFLLENSVVNEWSSNPDLGVATDWILSFPTKGFHVDQFCDQIQASNNQYRFDGAVPGGTPLTCADPGVYTEDDQLVKGVDYSIGAGDGTTGGIRIAPPSVPPAETDTFPNRWADGKSDVTIKYDLFDREEGAETASGTQQSPAAPGELPALPYETNVLAFTSDEDPNSAVASPIAQPIDASARLGGALYGWANLHFGVLNPVSLPVTGFMVKTRTFGTPDIHYGQIQNHGYTPGCDIPGAPLCRSMLNGN
jgi:hypothetical protein